MAGPQGALASVFKITRGLQAACLIAIIGMTANFVSVMVSANANPPQILIATLSIVCVAVLYAAITFVLFLDTLLPYLITTGIDTAFLVALVVVSVVVGKPVSYLDCNVLDDMTSSSTSSYDFTSALTSSLTSNNGRIDYSKWIGTSKATCLEIKSIWGLSMALCVLFAFSAAISASLWKKNRLPPAEKIEP